MTFIFMHGYGPYVWSCFSLVIAVAVVNLVVAQSQYKKTIEAIRRQHASDP